MQKEEGSTRIIDVLMDTNFKDGEEGDIDTLTILVEENPEYLRMQSGLSYPFQTPSEIYSREKENDNENKFVPLHIAVLNYASPEVVECLIQGDMETLNLKTSKGRTALDCARSLVAGEVLREDSSTEVKNAFAAIDLLDTNSKSLIKLSSLQESVKMANEFLTSMENMDSDSAELFDPKAKWKKLKNVLKFVNNLVLEESMLGPRVEKDMLPAVCPKGFHVPPNLKRVTVDTELPTGFHRLRRALLESKSSFFMNQYYAEKMRNVEVNMEEWDKFDTNIGSHSLPNDIDEKDFIGATRETQYIMPKSTFVSANKAIQTSVLIEYTDYCFAIKMVTKNPDVPFGKKFEAHTQWIFINGGRRKCRMVSSVECVFPGSKPLVAWKIKNAMFSACTDADVNFGNLVCEHANL